jgi:hypothetical protein
MHGNVLIALLYYTEDYAIMTTTKVESRPVPTELATKTDLSSQETKAITEAVNPLIADAFALYVKTPNFPWHLYGSHFRDYHELFDEHAEAILESTIQSVLCCYCKKPS